MSPRINNSPASLLCAFVIALLLLPFAQAESSKLQVLVLSGANNHDWKATTPAIVSALTETGRFEVKVEENVATLDATSFTPYDVILSNFNTIPKTDDPVWDAPTRAAFEAHLKAGNGLVIVHAGSSVFYDWPFFQKLASATWGGGTSHGEIHSEKVTFTATSSPITAGLQPFWIHDELWQNSQIAEGANVLATVTPLVARKGTGKPEPIVLSTEVDGARGFTLLLGHQVEVMQNVAWKTLLQRGTEWAATGQVSLPIPEEWPESEADADWQPSAALNHGSVADLIAALRVFQANGNRAALIAGVQTIGGLAREGGSAADQAADSLASLLADPHVSKAAKEFICQQLWLIGSARQIPALTALLEDSDLVFAAIRALEAVPGPESLAALKNAESTLNPEFVVLARAAVQQRAQQPGKFSPNPAEQFGNPPEVAAIITGLQDPNPAVQESAIRAAIVFYTPEFATAAADVIAELPATTKIPLLTLFAENAATTTVSRVEALAGNDPEPSVRTAALSALGRISDQKSVPLLVRSLDPNEPMVQTAATDALTRLNGDGINSAILDAMETSSPDVQVSALGVLGDRSALDQFDAILEFASSDDDRIRRAAIESLGEFSQAPQVEALVKASESATGPDLPLWGKTLIAASTFGDRNLAVETLAKSIQHASADRINILLPAIEATGTELATTVLIENLNSPNESTRRNVILSMGRSKNPTYLAPLLTFADKESVTGLRRLALRSVIEIAGVPTLDPLTALQGLNSAADLTQDSDDRKAILAALTTVKADGALQLANKIAATDPSVSTEAAAATQKLTELLGSTTN